MEKLIFRKVKEYEKYVRGEFPIEINDAVQDLAKEVGLTKRQVTAILLEFALDNYEIEGIKNGE